MRTTTDINNSVAVKERKQFQHPQLANVNEVQSHIYEVQLDMKYSQTRMRYSYDCK